MEDESMKRHYIVLTAAVVLIFFAGLNTGTLLGQEGRGLGRLKGFCISSDKKPIEGVKIILEYKEFNRKLTTVSDDTGKWLFVGLGPGTVSVIATKEDYVQGGIGLRVSGVSKNPEQFIVMKKESEVEPKVDDKTAALRAQFKKADTLFQDRKFDAALAAYQDFFKERPDLYKIRINIANCYLEMHRFDDAIAEYQEVLKAIIEKKTEVQGNPEVAKIYASIGDTYMRQDKLKEAESNFKKSIEISPEDHALAYNVAEILFAAGKTDDAVKYYDLAIKINPKWAKSYMQKGYAMLNKGDIKGALASFNRFLEIAPDSEEADGVREVIKSLK